MGPSRIALVAALAFTAHGQGVPGSTDPETAERWVKITNKYRCMHGVGKVGWSEQAASEAQLWLDMHVGLTSSRAVCDIPDGYAWENQDQGFSSLEQAVANWYAEKQNCNQQNQLNAGCYPGLGGETRKFTAMVWKGVTQIGCASNRSETTTGSSVYICRYLSGDSIGPQSANLGPQSSFADSVLPATKDESTCAASASGALKPPLPDPSTLYPSFTDYSDNLEMVCPGTRGALAHRLRREHKRTIAIICFSVLAVCCCCACIYSCRFVAKDKEPMPGTMSAMSEMEKVPFNASEEWRWTSYEKSQKQRIKDMSPFSKESRKAVEDGLKSINGK